jgi:protein-S-isoprenylcysteine O-methyltransferase Ste14
VICIISLTALGRSFGFVTADRGVKTRGPHALVRHPVYASCLLIQSGYVMQAVSLRNIAVFVVAAGVRMARSRRPVGVAGPGSLALPRARVVRGVVMAGSPFRVRRRRG